MSYVLGACAVPVDDDSIAEKSQLRRITTALDSETMTTTYVVFVCSGSLASGIMFEVDAPETVDPGQTFSLSIRAVHDLRPGYAPYSGTWSASVQATITNAVPSDLTLTWPDLAFTANQDIFDFGAVTVELTATGASNDFITLRATEFDYTLSPNDPAYPSIQNHCPEATDQPAIATITIDGVDPDPDDPDVFLPKCVMQCKHFRRYTDRQGNRFERRRDCVRFVHRFNTRRRAPACAGARSIAQRNRICNIVAAPVCA